MNPDHRECIVRQYSAEEGIPFYRKVMGDGASVIHYGIYDTPETSMRQATDTVSRLMWNTAMSCLSAGKEYQVVDLGSGLGGTAHTLAQEMRADVCCVDLCEHQNRDNLEQAQRLGIREKISTWTGSFDDLPMDWSERFDVAWSQEALCHAEKIDDVLAEVHRILKPGGVFVFSDILLAPELPSEKAKSFQSVNAVSQWRTQLEYQIALAAAGFEEVSYYDLTNHLQENFLRMRDQIERGRDDLLGQGVSEELLMRFHSSLSERLSWENDPVLCWGIFTSIKKMILDRK